MSDHVKLHTPLPAGSEIHITACRRLDNRAFGDWNDTSALAWDLHLRRYAALQEAFEDIGLEVRSWDGADDTTRTHEWTTVLAHIPPEVVSAAGGALPLLVPWIRDALGEALKSALSDSALEVVKRLIRRLRRAQEEQRFQDFVISVAGRTVMSVLPGDEDGSVSITLPGARVLTASWTQAPDDLSAAKDLGPAN